MGVEYILVDHSARECIHLGKRRRETGNEGYQINPEKIARFLATRDDNAALVLITDSSTAYDAVADQNYAVVETWYDPTEDDD